MRVLGVWKVGGLLHVLTDNWVVHEIPAWKTDEFERDRKYVGDTIAFEKVALEGLVVPLFRLQQVAMPANYELKKLLQKRSPA